MTQSQRTMAYGLTFQQKGKRVGRGHRHLDGALFWLVQVGVVVGRGGANGYRGPLISHLCIVSFQLVPTYRHLPLTKVHFFLFSLFLFLSKSQVCGHSHGPLWMLLMYFLA
jgi:hypothetical protein